MLHGCRQGSRSAVTLGRLPWFRPHAPTGGGGFCVVAYEGESSNPLYERHVYDKLFAPYTLALPLVLRNR